MRMRTLPGMVMALCLLAGFVTVPVRAAAGPNFQILQPAADTPITGGKIPLAIAFQSPETAPVVRFDAYLDSTWLIGGRIKNPIPVGSFRVDADLTEINPGFGQHTLIVKLVDSQGNTASNEMKISIQKPLSAHQVEHSKPMVRIVEPKNGAEIHDKINIRVEATDDSGIKWVTVYINGIFHAMTNEAPYVMMWNPIADKLNGPTTISARALDLFNNEGLSAPVIVNIIANKLGGPTTLEGATPEQNSNRVQMPEFPVIFTLVPTTGAELSRRTSASSPYTELLASLNTMVPDPLPAASREYMMALLPSGDALPVLPVKSLPGQAAMERATALTACQTTTAPALALAGIAPAQMLAGAAVMTAIRGTLYLPAEALDTSRRGSADAPVLIAMVPLLAKEQPASLPARDAASTAALSANQAIHPGAGSSASRQASGQPAIAGVRPENLPAGLQSAGRQQGADSPLLIALVPGALLKNTPSAATEPLGTAIAGNSAVALAGPADSAARARLVLGPTAVALRRAQTLPVNATPQLQPLLLAKAPAAAAETVVLLKRTPSAIAPSSTLQAIDTTRPVTPAIGGTMDTTTPSLRQPETRNATPVVRYDARSKPRDVAQAHPQSAAAGMPEKAAPQAGSVDVIAQPLPLGTLYAMTPGAGAADARRTASAHAPHLPATATSQPAISTTTPRTVWRAEPAVALVTLPGKATAGSSATLPASVPTPALLASAPLTPTSGAANSRHQTGGTPVMMTQKPGTVQPALPMAAARTAQNEQPAVAVVGLPGKLTPPTSKSGPRVGATLVAKTTPVTPEQGAGLSKPTASALAPTMDVVGPYIVKRGDTLVQIAKANSTTPEELVKMNPGISPEHPLSAGARLVVPKTEARIYLDNVPITGVPQPYVVNGTSMVPLRKLVEAKGGIVVWIPTTREVNAWTSDKTYLNVKIGKQGVHIDNENYMLPVAPAIRNARTMVPIRFMMTALKLQLSYNPASGTYSLISQAK